MSKKEVTLLDVVTYEAGMDEGIEKCAAGPWVKTEREEPPKDGTEILAYFGREKFLALASWKTWREPDGIKKGWRSPDGYVCEFDDPVAWALVKMPPKRWKL